MPPAPAPQAEPALAAETATSAQATELQAALERALRHAEQQGKDLQNYRRHAEQELAAKERNARLELLAELGEVLRSLEQALGSPQADLAALREGVALTGRALQAVYRRHGLERIPTAGERFDPTLHEAVFTEAGEGLASGTVVREISPGFRSAERVVRPAKVSVAA